MELLTQVFFLALGFVLLVKGADWFVEGAASIADKLYLNTPITIPFIYLGFGAGLAVFMFSGFIKSIPLEIEEAAAIDGCNPVQTFFKIVLLFFRHLSHEIICPSRNDIPPASVLLETIFLHRKSYSLLNPVQKKASPCGDAFCYFP